jgi:hypothetical protein
MVLENVVYARAHNSEQQLTLLDDAAALMSEDRYVPRRAPHIKRCVPSRVVVTCFCGNALASPTSQHEVRALC